MDLNFGGAVYDDSARRAQLAESSYNGIDYVEVDAAGSTNQYVLRVYFIPAGPDAPKPEGQDAPKDKVTHLLQELDGKRDAFSIEGGSRVRNVYVDKAEYVEQEEHIKLTVSRRGDFSDYVLRISCQDCFYPLDEFYAQVTFNFKAGCPARFDCRRPLVCPPEPADEILIDYMAKDYESFRQAMIDLLPKLIPDWSERRVADLGMTLLELLAYAGDQLSYYQDAVANEAYLETARQRVSVRRHARLVDYHMHDGLAARTIIHFTLGAGKQMTLAATTDEDLIVQVMTQPRGLSLPHVIPVDRAYEALAATDTVFEIHLGRANLAEGRPAQALHFHQKLNQLTLYNWGNQVTSLPVGATSADILGDYKCSEGDDQWRLKKGDLLLFEELIDPIKGQELLADPGHRHLVRITEIEEPKVDDLATEIIQEAKDNMSDLVDHLDEDLGILVDYLTEEGNAGNIRVPGYYDLETLAKYLNAPMEEANRIAIPVDVAQKLFDYLKELIKGDGEVKFTRIHWHALDALPSRLWISNVTQEGKALPAISVARGNLAVADYGRTFSEWYPRPPSPGVDLSGIRSRQRAFRLRLQEAPLAHSIPLHTLAAEPAAALRQANPGQGFPAIHRIDSTTHDASGAKRERFWHVVTPSLLNSHRFAEDVVVEMDNTGHANLRFGDNEYGSLPDDNSFFQIRYRVGIGPQGNIGADKLDYVIRHDDHDTMNNITQVRNPLPAWGGTPPESMEKVKRLAPAAFRAAVKRAVTAKDYKQITELHPDVERAKASFQWTGSWHTVFVRVDPRGTAEIDDDLRKKLVRHVDQYAMTGYDVEIVDPIYIPLEITLDICVEPGYFAGDVERAVIEALSNQRLPDGRVGFFYPDQFTFGQRLYISRIYAAVEEVAGVQSVEIASIHRQYATDPEGDTGANLDRGFIDVDESAVIRLDNSPNFPGNGLLHLNMLGGNA